MQNIRAAKIDVFGVVRFELPPRRDGCELDDIEIPVGLERHAAVLDILERVAVHADLPLVPRTVRNIEAAISVHRDVQTQAAGACRDANARHRAAAAHPDRGAARLIALREVCDQADVERVGGHPEQLAAQRVALPVIPGVLALDVLKGAIAFAPDSRESNAQNFVNQRRRKTGGDAPVIEIAELELSKGLRIGESRALRHHVHGTGGGVLAEQRALRAAQDLDALDVEQIAERLPRTAPIDAVDESAHGGLEADVVAGRADAADAQRAARRRGVARIDVNAGRDLREVFDLVDAPRFELVALERADRDRNFLDVRVALGRGDDDFFDAPLRGLRLCGCFRRGSGRCLLSKGRSGCEQRRCGEQRHQSHA